MGGPWICPNAPVIAEPQAVVLAPDVVLGTVRSAYTNAHPFYDVRGDSWWVFPAAPPRPRATSYTFNSWLFFRVGAPGPWTTEPIFTQESQMKQPLWTPVLSDGILPFIHTWEDWPPPSNPVSPFYGT